MHEQLQLQKMHDNKIREGGGGGRDGGGGRRRRLISD